MIDVQELPSEVFSMPMTESTIDDKNESILEAETRGIDFKGNVRYFCPRCNVRYIGRRLVYFLEDEFGLDFILILWI